MIMMADEFQDLQGELTSSRPRRVDGVVLIQRLAGSGPRKDQCFSSCPKAGKD